ncbi:hypothetical protein OROHE_017320 [Orobanche hederae]
MLWIAEGFIQREDGLNFEQSAEKILDDLINMNLLSVKKKNLHQVKTCGVHGMVREFCKPKAKHKNFFRVVKKSEHGVIEPLLFDEPNIHRLCLPYDVLYLGFTRSVKFSPYLKRLTLSKTQLKWPHYMHILAKINTLKVLKLKDNVFIRDTWKVGDGEGFSGLQFLLIENSMLCTWTVSATHFLRDNENLIDRVKPIYSTSYADSGKFTSFNFSRWLYFSKENVSKR